jgi:hypothetical protein
MFFDFHDPQEAKRLIEQLKISFEKAASVPCAAQRQFINLSANFNNLAQLAEKFISSPADANPMTIMTQLLPAAFTLNDSFHSIRLAAETDPEVRKVATELLGDIRENAKILLRNMPHFPGLPDFSGYRDTNEDSQPPSPPKKKNRPGSGDFTL